MFILNRLNDLIFWYGNISNLYFPCFSAVKRKNIVNTLAVILFGPGGFFMSKMQRAGMREGGLPLPPAFQYLILMM